jgi:signal transduction histidine kinase
MPASLEYAPPVRLMRKRLGVVLLVVPALVVSYWLAVPRVRTFRDHQERRAAVRQMVAAQLGNARAALESKDLSRAASALLAAQFPRHLDGHLFRSSELQALDEQIAAVSEPLKAADAKDRQEQEQTLRNEREAQRQRQIVNGIRTGCTVSDRQQTICALVDRAASQLRAGNTNAAQAICAQVLRLDPTRIFDQPFWQNARPKR